MVTEKRGATRSEFQAFARSEGASEMMVPAEIVVAREDAAARHRQDRLAALQKFVREHAATKAAAAE